jgi:hypothetical protein
LTITEWDPVSKQPMFKVGAVRVTKIADADGKPSLAPTTTASAPVENGASGPRPEPTVGGGLAEVTETVKEG